MLFMWRGRVHLRNKKKKCAETCRIASASIYNTTDDELNSRHRNLTNNYARLRRMRYVALPLSTRCSES